MRQRSVWIATVCILALAGLFPAFSSGASPASKEKVIYSFTGGLDGGNPFSDLTVDAEGNLYGTTGGGGSSGYGTVFELKRSKDGWKEEVLYSFTGGSDGGFPESGVIFDNAGNLYGTTVEGGSDGGTVFKLAPNHHGGWKKSVLYSFVFYGKDGSNPQADLAFDSQGNLYGTTPVGAHFGTSCNSNGCGTVFELRPQLDGSWTEETIHTFMGAPNDGGVPAGRVVVDSGGNVYGTTRYGGVGSCLVGSRAIGLTYGCGTIFKLTSSSGGTWSETVLYNFVRGGGFGIYPSGELLVDNAIHLLGVTLAGGDGFGTAFELRDVKAKSWQQSESHIFYGYPDGTRPAGRLLMDANGDLFGVTPSGGTSTNGLGTVFKLERTTNGWRERIVHNFTGAPDGAQPSAGLVSNSQGHLFGTTPYGGGTACANGCGTVYEITP